MGFRIEQHEGFPTKQSYKPIKHENYNTRVALRQIPHRNKYKPYDIDNSKWLETINNYYGNEIEKAEKELGVSFSRYKVYTKFIEYKDETTEEISKYPNGNEVKVINGLNHVFVHIKDKLGKLIAEKIYNYDNNDGRKVLYKYLKKGDDILKVVQIYSYDTTKNIKSDIIDFGYTSDTSILTNNCKFEGEFCLLNGKDVELVKSKAGKYIVKDKNGKKFTFIDAETK